MTLFNIMEIEKRFIIEIGDYISDELIPLFEKAFDYGKEFTEDNKFIMSINDYTCWTGVTEGGSKLFFFDTNVAIFEIKIINVSNENELDSDNGDYKLVSIRETWRDGSKNECIFIDMGDNIEKYKEYRYNFNVRNLATVREILMWFASVCETELREYCEKYDF